MRGSAALLLRTGDDAGTTPAKRGNSAVYLSDTSSGITSNIAVGEGVVTALDLVVRRLRARQRTRPARTS